VGLYSPPTADTGPRGIPFPSESSVSHRVTPQPSVNSPCSRRARTSNHRSILFSSRNRTCNAFSTTRRARVNCCARLSYETGSPFCSYYESGRRAWQVEHVYARKLFWSRGKSIIGRIRLRLEQRFFVKLRVRWLKRL
jgi:hypothetical protein